MKIPRNAGVRILEVIQSRRGSMATRAIWILLGVLISVRFQWTIAAAFYSAWTAVVFGGYTGDVWGLALRLLGPVPILVFVGLWVLVFVRLRPKKELPTALVALTRFCHDHQRFGEVVRDIPVENQLWTVMFQPARESAAPRPVEIQSQGCRPEAASEVVQFPGVTVTVPPRCLKCGFEISEEPFAGGYYRLCRTCNHRVISRESLQETADKLQQLVAQAWRLTA